MQTCVYLCAEFYAMAVSPRLGQEPGLSYIKCHFSFIECNPTFVIPHVYHKGTENMQYGSRTSHLLQKK